MSLTDPDWQFDDECPNCGESVHLGAVVEEYSAGDPVEVTMYCGASPSADVLENVRRGAGCGHTWDWAP